ncbi:MAG TPA: ribonuclease R [Alphaproteobacteria bacterium]|nr:ribonuclease R [Alphaproteobacteria bacterium]
MGRSRTSPTAPLDPDSVVRFLSAHGPSDRRAIARGLGARDAQRSELRMLLRSLVADGRVTLVKGRRYSVGGALKPVQVLEIVGPDTDGELLAKPTDWDGPGDPPPIYVAPPRDEGPAPAPGERILAKLREDPDGGYDAFILRRLGAGPAEVLGIFRLADGKGRIDPTDRRAKTSFMVDVAHIKGAKPGDLVRAVALPRRSAGLPTARIVERIGHLDDPGVVSLIAIHAHGIPTVFSDPVLEETRAAIPPTVVGREDLRGETLVTIDGEDARDFDDAVWAEPDSDPHNAGGFHLVVAIADVAYYVRSGAPLDRSAYERGNSVYMPDRVVPMLPERLSNDLCSLRPDEDRPVLAAHMWIDAHGNMRRHHFVRAMIRSQARLTYEQAQAIHDGSHTAAEPPVTAMVRGPLYGAFAALSEAREKRGTLDLDLPEYTVVFGAGGEIDRIARRNRLASHRLIEEFMILANVAAAETLEKHRFPCMYRVHDRPDEAKVEALRQYLDTLGIKLAKGQVLRSATFANILERVKDMPFATEVNELVLRTQSQAIYSPENIGHFGLALRRYAHFTSPIRRYSDLLVHRALIGALDLGDGGIDRAAGESFVRAGEHISGTERRAVAAEREAMERYLTLFLADKVGARFAGRVSGVTRFGLFVALDEIGAQGLIPVSTLGTERFRHDERRHVLEGLRTGTLYRLGQRVEVVVREASPVTGGLVLGLVGRHESADGASGQMVPRQKGRSFRPPPRRGRRR